MISYETSKNQPDAAFNGNLNKGDNGETITFATVQPATPPACGTPACPLAVTKQRLYLPFSNPVLVLNAKESLQNISDASQNRLMGSLGELTGLSVELSGSQNFALPPATVNPEKNLIFNNLNFAVFYNVTDDFLIGFDYRRENFFLAFTGTEKSGQKFKYEIQPNLTTYSGIFRYEFNDLGKVYPVFQLTAGGNNYGAVLRFLGGFSYSPYSDIKFLLGFEYSNMIFTHQSQNFIANRLGFNYGVMFKF